MRILLLADLHIGARFLDWDRTSQRPDPIRAWSDAVDLAVSEPVDAVLVAGDLFDRPDPEPADTEEVAAGIERMAAAGRAVVLLPGGYDGLCRPHGFYLDAALPEGCRAVTWPGPERLALEVGDGVLHLNSFASIPGRTPAEPFAALRCGEEEGYQVGLVHARLEDEPAVPPTAWGRPPLTLAEIGRTGLDLLVVGGGHEFRSEICGGVPLVQPGSPLALRPGENRERAFTIAVLGADGVEIERHACPDGAESAEPETAAAPPEDERELRERLRDELSVRGLFIRRLERQLEETDDPARRKVLERALAMGLEEFKRLEVRRAG